MRVTEILTLFFFQPEELGSEEPLKNNLLSVRKPAVGRTHSLPNDSYMLFPPQHFGPSPLSPPAQSQGPQHIRGCQTGNETYLIWTNVSELPVLFFFFTCQFCALQAPVARWGHNLRSFQSCWLFPQTSSGPSATTATQTPRVYHDNTRPDAHTRSAARSAGRWINPLVSNLHVTAKRCLKGC